MEDTATYQCELCEKKMSIKKGEPVPECCRQPMKELELPTCQLAETPEHARMDDFGDPCDDGRSGKI
jgi:hypothetical protein